MLGTVRIRRDLAARARGGVDGQQRQRGLAGGGEQLLGLHLGVGRVGGDSLARVERGTAADGEDEVGVPVAGDAAALIDGRNQRVLLNFIEDLVGDARLGERRFGVGQRAALARRGLAADDEAARAEGRVV